MENYEEKSIKNCLQFDLTTYSTVDCNTTVVGISVYLSNAEYRIHSSCFRRVKSKFHVSLDMYFFYKEKWL